MTRNLFLSCLLVLLSTMSAGAEERRVDPESLVGKSVNAALETLGLRLEQVLLTDEPPGVFSSVYLCRERAGKVLGAEGKGLAIYPAQKTQMFSEKRTWDKKAIGEMIVERATIE